MPASTIEELSHGIRALRDPTRGGLSTTLKEFALESGQRILVREADIPVLPSVRGACDLLGLDPLYVANEGLLQTAAAGTRILDMIAGEQLPRIC